MEPPPSRDLSSSGGILSSFSRSSFRFIRDRVDCRRYSHLRTGRHAQRSYGRPRQELHIAAREMSPTRNKAEPEKLNIHQRSVTYMGHLFTHQGLKADPRKIDAICNMPAPTNKEGVQRLLGTVNYLAKFVPNMSKITAPLRTLMRTETEWSWDPNIHGRSFDAVKKTLQNAPSAEIFRQQPPVSGGCSM